MIAYEAFPDETILVARGKYATLSKERRKQLERVRDVCSSIVTAAQAALRDCELMPPESEGPIQTIETCLHNLKDARLRIVGLATNMNELRTEAWQE